MVATLLFVIVAVLGLVFGLPWLIVAVWWIASSCGYSARPAWRRIRYWVRYNWWVARCLLLGELSGVAAFDYRHRWPFPANHELRVLGVDIPKRPADIPPWDWARAEQLLVRAALAVGGPEQTLPPVAMGRLWRIAAIELRGTLGVKTPEEKVAAELREEIEKLTVEQGVDREIFTFRPPLTVVDVDDEEKEED